MNDLTVETLMTRDVLTVTPETPVREAAGRLAARGVSAAPVVESGRVVGILSESDVVRALAPTPGSGLRRMSVLDHLLYGRDRSRSRQGTPYTVRQAMTPAVFSVPPGASIWEAAAAMARHGVKRLPVMTDVRRLVGIISRADLVRAMARDDASVEADVVRALELLGEASSGVDVEVRDAEVTLGGVAGRPATIRLANDLAARTPGVVRVRNLIALHPPADPETGEQVPQVPARTSSAGTGEA